MKIAPVGVQLVAQHTARAAAATRAFTDGITLYDHHAHITISLQTHSLWTSRRVGEKWSDLGAIISAVAPPLSLRLALAKVYMVSVLDSLRLV